MPDTKNRFSQSLAVLEGNEVQAAASSPPTATMASVAPLLSEIVTKIPPKNRGISTTLYLSRAVIQAVEQEAKLRKLGKSKLVDEVLKRVLLES